MNRRERYAAVIAYFRSAMPTAGSELQFGSVFQLLVAVVLSAQCTDKRVNSVTPALFKHYPTAQAMAEAEPEDILEYIKSVSYPNSKASHLAQMARQIVERFGGEVPSDIDALTSLQGVGRKTANVMMAVAFGKAAMPVDTHVFRVSHRLGLVAKSDDTPLKVERNLTRNIPSEDLSRAHHWLLLHGRYVCTSRSPHCHDCGLKDLCPSAKES